MTCFLTSCLVYPLDRFHAKGGGFEAYCPVLACAPAPAEQGPMELEAQRCTACSDRHGRCWVHVRTAWHVSILMQLSKSQVVCELVACALYSQCRTLQLQPGPSSHCVAACLPTALLLWHLHCFAVAVLPEFLVRASTALYASMAGLQAWQGGRWHS